MEVSVLRRVGWPWRSCIGEGLRVPRGDWGFVDSYGS